MDETKMKSDIFEMTEGKELESVMVLAGNPSLEVVNNYYRERTLPLQYPFFLDWKTCSTYRPAYKAFALAKMAELGEESDEFRTQFNCEWIIQRQKPFSAFADRMTLKYEWNIDNLRAAGVDNAKDIDFTVATIIERTGDRKIIIDWLELQGNDYQEQAELEAAFIKSYAPVVLLLSDATGQQDRTPRDTDF
jgi:hypothetical protein